MKSTVVDTKPLLISLSELQRSKTGNRSLAKRFNKSDRIALLEFLKNTERAWITPQVLAEVTTHISSDQIQYKFFSTLLEQPSFEDLEECYIRKSKLSDTGKVPEFGFTDISIVETGREKDAEIITSDKSLLDYCQRTGLSSRHVESVYSTWI
ncbi:MAG: hypothetical protein ABEJ03_02090 [Candidatus Nanohaloarchaea archaeon]